MKTERKQIGEMEGWWCKHPEGDKGMELNQATNKHKRMNSQIKNSESHLELMAPISIKASILCSYQLNFYVLWQLCFFFFSLLWFNDLGLLFLFFPPWPKRQSDCCGVHGMSNRGRRLSFKAMQQYWFSSILNSSSITITILFSSKHLSDFPNQY